MFLHSPTKHLTVHAAVPNLVRIKFLVFPRFAKLNPSNRTLKLRLAVRLVKSCFFACSASLASRNCILPLAHAFTSIPSSDCTLQASYYHCLSLPACLERIPRRKD
ncbi:unnamed protein product [Protopolystoma xenopodis]|uniref:Uncharacterized protein n=1 Tax=Protopolystoma xenopodis TaxID=117903 RepID=A0A448WUD2_9PLAT|nr:unnamed protein product [Protopolystoma xenopodis]